MKTAFKAMNIYVAAYDDNDNPASKGNPGPPGTPGSPGAPGASASGQGAGTAFTQDDVNKFLAEDRRKHQDRYTQLETNYEKLLANQNLSGDQRNELQVQLEDLQARYRTKEQQAEFESQKRSKEYQDHLKKLETESQQWRQRYTDTTIQQSIHEAAVQFDAYNPNLVVSHLRQNTQVEELKDKDGKPTGQFAPVVTLKSRNPETGIDEALKMTPQEAVEFLHKDPVNYGGFFKNNLRDGIGSTNATGGATTGSGQLDAAKMTDAEYFRIRKENRSLLGL